MKCIRLLSILLLTNLLFISFSHKAEATRAISYGDVIYKGKTYNILSLMFVETALADQFSGCYDIKKCRVKHRNYELINNHLYVKELTIYKEDKNYLPIKGIKPVIDEKNSYATYRNLKIALRETGKFRLGHNYIHTIQMKSAKPAINYETVLDITFKKGRVVKIEDRSIEVKRKREAYNKYKEEKKKTGNTANAPVTYIPFDDHIKE